MFGKNQVMHADHGDGYTLSIISIFHTIQGEGPLAGQPAVFVRLAGCNLRCHFCDTNFEEGATTVTTADIVNEVDFLLDEHPFTCNVVITGGEPLRQNIFALCEMINDIRSDIVVQIETAGTLWVDRIEEVAMIVCSPKTPKIHPQVLEFCEHYKYIVTAGQVSLSDGLPIVSTQVAGQTAFIQRPPAHIPREQIFVQACDEYNDVKNQANLEQAAKSCLLFGYTLSVQIHKLAGLE